MEASPAFTTSYVIFALLLVAILSAEIVQRRRRRIREAQRKMAVLEIACIADRRHASRNRTRSKTLLDSFPELAVADRKHAL